MIRLDRAGIFALVSILSLLLASPARPQSLTRGGVDGIVRDSAGAPLAGTSVILRDLATGTSRTFTTTRNGRFRFSLLLPGEYELLAERFGSRPRRVRGIPVSPGRRIDLSVQLAGAGAAGADTIRYSGAGFGALGAGGGRHFGAGELRDLPELRRELSGVGRLTSISGPDLEVQGLPGEMSGVVVDGIPVTLARTPLPMGMISGATHLALGAFEGAGLATAGVDVELPGRGGGLLSGYTRRGTPEFRAEGFARAGAGTPSLAGATGPEQEIGGGVVMTGPLATDAASFALGLEGWLARTDPAAGALRDSLAAELSRISADRFGVALPDLAQPATRGGALSGFGRVDWQVAAEHSLSARANFGLFSSAPGALGASPASWADSRFDGGQLSTGLEAISRLGDRLTQSIRVGFELIDRDYLPAGRLAIPDLRDQAIAATRVLGDEWSYSLASGHAGSLGQAVARASETLSYETDRHALKGGLAVALTSYHFSSGEDGAGEFLFTGLDAFSLREGTFVQTLGGGADAAFTLPRLTGFLQDEWRAAPGLELLAGVRYDLEALPKSEVAASADWTARSGIDPLGFRATIGRVSPRAAFRWDPGLAGHWLLSGNLGLYAEPIDPALFAGLVANASPVTVRRGSGRVESWPLLPDSTTAPVLGPRLSLLAPAFAGPRTLRASFGLARRLWEGTTAQISVDYRRTDLLPRARDLNLLPLPLSHDQHGRPVYGRLRQHGSLLVPEPGSNRRFTGFDQVLSTDVDGWSAFQGVTVSADHRGARGTSLFASYTLSHTRDNWPRGASGAPELPAFPDSRERGEWSEGTGDLDVPHRLVVVAAGPTPGLQGLRLGAVYRYRSGYAFTPGFRDAVDVNGDGSARNDPAFVDTGIAGVPELLAAWPCLAASAGRFAARNSCRGPDAHALDLRASFAVSRTASYTLTLQADGLDLLGGEHASLDRALFVVDDALELRDDAAAGVVTVPLRVNEHFGESYRPALGGRVFRLGLRLDYR